MYSKITKIEVSGFKYYLFPSIKIMHMFFTFIYPLFKCLLFQETDEEDLTPEERRKLERKLKKERKKEEKKLMREAGIPTKKEEPKKLSGSELALAYLTR